MGEGVAGVGGEGGSWGGVGERGSWGGVGEGVAGVGWRCH